MVVFQNRASVPEKVPEITYPRLDPETYNDAKIVAPGYDVWLSRNSRGDPNILESQVNPKSR
jgi:hypothetical protein